MDTPKQREVNRRLRQARKHYHDRMVLQDQGWTNGIVSIPMNHNQRRQLERKKAVQSASSEAVRTV
ncbi:MAG: hypothetical protein C5B59_12715 [Bacteroidetes bacterium]|nr:MAG: hypothetical protein C5B59_12715 [Bacteroidota bacterium]